MTQIVPPCLFDTWNYKYNQFVPLRVIEKVDSKFVKVIEYPWRLDKETGERVVIEEISTMTWIKAIRNIGEFEPMDQTFLFQEGTRILVNGYGLIVDKSIEVDGGFKIYYKYIQATKEKLEDLKKINPSWCFLGSRGYQFKKQNVGYNFITIASDDLVEFISELPGISHLKEEETRKLWYFFDSVNQETIEYLEKALGLIRDDGLTWTEYLIQNLTCPMVVKVSAFGKLYWTDLTDQKKPIFPTWVKIKGKDITVEKDLTSEELISDMVEYMKKKEGTL